jgi:hypothetical protein
LPEDLTDLQFLQQEQEQLATDLEQQISDNEAIKAEYEDRIAEAQELMDDAGLDNIYAEMEAAGYTDPTLLQSNLDKVNSNIGILAQAIDDAGNALNTPENTGEDGDPTEDTQDDETTSRELTDEEIDALFAEENTDEQQDEWWA